MEFLNLKLGLPWWATFIIVFLSTILGFMSKRALSKDTTQTELVKQALQRQNSLDEQQSAMMRTLQDEVRRFTADVNMIREELNEERRRNTTLQTQVEILTLENRELKTIMDSLKRENRELKQKLQPSSN